MNNESHINELTYNELLTGVGNFKERVSFNYHLSTDTCCVSEGNSRNTFITNLLRAKHYTFEI